MSNNILKVKYYGNGQFKGSEGASIFQSSNQQSTLQFKFDEDLGDASVVANILIPYPEGSQLYGQHQTQSLFMKKQVDAEGGYIYSGAILGGYLATNGKAYVNAQVYASDGYIDSTNTGHAIAVNGIPYYIDYTTETIDGVSHDLLVLEDANTGRIYTQQQEGIIVLEHDLICLIKQFVASRDGDGLFDGTLRLTSGVQVKNYQQVEFKITASAPYYAPYPLTIEESYLVRQELATAQSDILALQTDKQDKNDPTINQDGIDHTVAGNINDLLGRTKTAEDDIDTLQGEMTQAQIDIADLQRVIGTGIDFVGVMRWNADTELTPLPTDADVEAFVLQETGEQPRAAQAVIVEVAKTNDPDEVYIYTYDGATWRHYAIQFMNKAQNGNEGVIEGDYTIGGLSTYDNFMVSIVNGKIINIYRVDTNGNSIDYKTMADQVIAKLVGNTPVNRATADKNGNDIYNTYQTKQEGASKDYVQDYASPKALYDINYSNYALGKFEKVNVADNSYNKTITSAQIGDTLLGTINLTLDSDILLGDQNGLQQKIWLSSTRTEGVKLRLEAYYQHNGGQTYSLLGTPTLTDTISLVANTPTLVTIENLFDNLSTPVTVESGMNISIMLYVWREDSTSADFTLLSNTTYPAYMELNKIGFVRYSLEAEPDAIVCGHDSAPTIDSDGDLLVSSTDGEINYKNGNSAPLTTILKIPMDNGLNDPTSVLPARAGQVANVINRLEIDISSWGSTLTNEQYALISTHPLPRLIKNNVIYEPASENGAYITWTILQSGAKVSNSIVLTKSTKRITAQAYNIVDFTGVVQNYAPIYSSTSTYAVGDLAIYDGILYQCNTAISTPESFDPSHWTQTDIKTLQKALEDGKADKVVVDTASTSPITLANNTSFRLGTISALTINNPSEYALDFECEVIFTADSTISMTYSAVAPTWSGDDVAGGIFTPQANKTYNILFFNNGTSVGSPSIQAIVRGV